MTKTDIAVSGIYTDSQFTIFITLNFGASKITFNKRYTVYKVCPLHIEICVDCRVLGSDGESSICYDEDPRSFGW